MEVVGPVVSHQNQKNRFPSPLFSRRELIRAALLAAAAPVLGPTFSFAQAIFSGLTPAARGEDGSEVLRDPNWKPAFLDEHQNATLIALGDVIIPATDTPGAKAALVNRYLDLLLSIQPAEFQKRFLAALAFIDTESQKEFGNDFLNLTPENQIWLSNQWAFPRESSRWTERHEGRGEPEELGERNFQLLKTLIAAGYYESEIGQKELGWDGEFTHGPYQGCEHPATTHS
jgi:glucoside 3-dehydrogenase (cytochrome c) hitch-hiker subunit